MSRTKRRQAQIRKSSALFKDTLENVGNALRAAYYALAIWLGL